MIIRRETIKAVLSATTDDKTRYNLSSVQIEPDGLCVATNGHVLLTAKDRLPFDEADFPRPAGSRAAVSSPDKSVLLDKSMAERLIGATAKKPTIPILQAVQVGQDAAGPFAVATDLTIPVTVDLQATDGPDAPRFPAWRRGMPKDDQPMLRLKLGVPVLEALIKAAKAVTVGKASANGPFITLEIPTSPESFAKTGDSSSGLIVAFRVTITGTDADVVGCAMPVQM